MDCAHRSLSIPSLLLSFPAPHRVRSSPMRLAAQFPTGMQNSRGCIDQEDPKASVRSHYWRWITVYFYCECEDRMKWHQKNVKLWTNLIPNCSLRTKLVLVWNMERCIWWNCGLPIVCNLDFFTPRQESVFSSIGGEASSAQVISGQKKRWCKTVLHATVQGTTKMLLLGLVT